MLEIEFLRRFPQKSEELLRRKDPTINLASILELDAKARDLKQSSDQKRQEKNQLAKRGEQLKREGKSNFDEIKQRSIALDEELAELNRDWATIRQELQEALASLPNFPQEDIFVAMDPKENICIKQWGKKRAFDFTPQHHVELNEKLEILEFKKTATFSGSGWIAYWDWGARLEWALINYMIDQHKKNKLTMVIPPIAVRPETLYQSGQLPKFADQVYKTEGKNEGLYLIPTAEVVLNAFFAQKQFPEDELPKKLFAYSPCFRKEAGAAGSQERGLIRLHQFNKVEMFYFTTAEQSDAAFDEMQRFAQDILEGLGMHYRSMLLVTGDMSFAAKKTVDIEVYLPGQNRYYEVSSVSNCGDFQTRRTNTRVKYKDGRIALAHTLNGSGLATSRLMVALLENGQQEDGSIIIPEALHPYLDGLKKIEPSR